MQQQHLSGDVAERGLVAANHAGKDVIDDHRRDGGEQADGRRQQRFRDARRYHRKVGSLRLLIIFMVAAPLATVDVKVNLPASSSQPQPRPEKPIYLSVKADKSMFLGNDPITEANMINALDSLTAGKKDTTVFFRADKTVDYETMMKVMDTLHQAGYLKIGLVGEETVKAK